MRFELFFLVLLELQTKLEQYEKEKLEAQGKFQEVAANERKRAAELEKRLLDTEARFAYQTVSSQVEAEAARMGVVDADALLKLTDLTQITIDEHFKADPNSVKRVLEDIAKQRPYLFQRNAAQPKDAAPRGGQAAPAQKSVKDMTPDERWALVKSRAETKR